MVLNEQKTETGIDAILNQKNQDQGRYSPTSQVGVDFLLVSPENDTSKQNRVNSVTKEIETLTQRPFKNTNTVDVSSSNFSDSEIMAADLLALRARIAQQITEYNNSPEGKNEKFRYDLTEAQAFDADTLHMFATIRKAGKPVGGFLMSALRTKIERVDTNLNDILSEHEEKKNSQNNQQRQQQNQKIWS